MAVYPKVIVYADPSDFLFVGRVVTRVTAHDYEWPADGITMVRFTLIGGKTLDFGVRRNKGSVTVYGPTAPALHVER